MSKSKGGGISISTIIFLIILYNVFFGDDEKEIEIIDNAKEIASDIRQSETAQKLIKAAKKGIERLEQNDEDIIIEPMQEEESAEPETMKITEMEDKESGQKPRIITPDEEDQNKDVDEEFEKL